MNRDEVTKRNMMRFMAPGWSVGSVGLNSSHNNEAASSGEPRRLQSWWKTRTSLKAENLDFVR